MPKSNPPAQGLNQARRAPPAGRAADPRSRSGRVLVGGHIAKEVQRALRILAAEESTTVQALLAEGIDAVFAKRGKPKIAGLPTFRPV